MNDVLEEFARRFLRGRINWWNILRRGNIINFGNIISMKLYHEYPFQVELFIVPYDQSSFTVHRHPHVDVIEFGLTGEADLFINGKASCSKEDVHSWLCGSIPTSPIRIRPEDYHSGNGYTPYAFLSIQHWLDGVPMTSVGLDWVGEASSKEQEDMLRGLYG